MECASPIEGNGAPHQCPLEAVANYLILSCRTIFDDVLHRRHYDNCTGSLTRLNCNEEAFKGKFFHHADGRFAMSFREAGIISDKTSFINL